MANVPLSGATNTAAINLVAAEGTNAALQLVNANNEGDYSGLYMEPTSTAITAAKGAGSFGASVHIFAGDGDTDFNGGDVTFTPGAGAGSGVDGNFIINNLPTADPTVAGALWNDSGTLKVSAG